ncbi:copper homeostasis membrane protein CopD [Sphingomonas paucimobilis]|uniref:copper homeostasis membrane protein CopD n=1 Tax=Sphingomonas paucimobilis TaxID=13689 RepID=UPI003792FAF9
MLDWPTVAIRLALYLVLAALFGLSAFSLYGLRLGERDDAIALRPWLTASAALGLLLSAAGLILMASAMAGSPFWPIDQAAAAALLGGSAVGTAWKVRMVALVIAGGAALLARGRASWLAMAMIAAAAALATLAWNGHGAASEGSTGWLHLTADILHLLAAGLWVGALFGLLLLMARRAEEIDAAHLRLTHRALHGFGSVGTLVVVTLVVTGLINSWLLVGPTNFMGTTLYGLLLLAKLALFAGMLGLASLNRFRLTPAFERSIAMNDHGGALTALRVSLAVETACVIGILALVAWLGTLAPPASGM